MDSAVQTDSESENDAISENSNSLKLQKSQKRRKSKKRTKRKKRKTKSVKPPLTMAPTIPIDDEPMTPMTGHESPSPLSGSSRGIRTPKRSRSRSGYQRFPDQRERSTLLAAAQMAPPMSPYSFYSSPITIQPRSSRQQVLSPQQQDTRNMMVLRQWEQTQLERRRVAEQQSQQISALQQDSLPSVSPSVDAIFEGLGVRPEGNMVEFWVNMIRGLILGAVVFFLWSIFSFVPGPGSLGSAPRYQHSPSPVTAVPPFARQPTEQTTSMMPVIMLGVGMVLMCIMMLKCNRNANNPVFWISWLFLVVLCYGGIRQMIDYDGHLPSTRYSHRGNPGKYANKYAPDYQFDEDFDDYFNRYHHDPVIRNPEKTDPVKSADADNKHHQRPARRPKHSKILKDRRKNHQQKYGSHDSHESHGPVASNLRSNETKIESNQQPLKDYNGPTRSDSWIHYAIDIGVSFVVVSCLSYFTPNQKGSFLVMMTVIAISILVFFAVMDTVISNALELSDQQFIVMMALIVCIGIGCRVVARCLKGTNLLTANRLMKVAVVAVIGWFTYFYGALLAIQAIIAMGLIAFAIATIVAYGQVVRSTINDTIKEQQQAEEKEREREIHHSEFSDPSNPYLFNPYLMRSSNVIDSGRRRLSRRSLSDPSILSRSISGRSSRSRSRSRSRRRHHRSATSCRSL